MFTFGSANRAYADTSKPLMQTNVAHHQKANPAFISVLHLNVNPKGLSI